MLKKIIEIIDFLSLISFLIGMGIAFYYTFKYFMVIRIIAIINYPINLVVKPLIPLSISIILSIISFKLKKINKKS